MHDSFLRHSTLQWQSGNYHPVTGTVEVCLPKVRFHLLATAIHRLLFTSSSSTVVANEGDILSLVFLIIISSKVYIVTD